MAEALGRSSVHPVIGLQADAALDALRELDVLLLLDVQLSPESQSRWLDGCQALSQERKRPLEVWLAVPEFTPEWKALCSKWERGSWLIFRGFELPSGPGALRADIAAKRTVSLARRDHSSYLVSGNRGRLMASFDRLVGR